MSKLSLLILCSFLFVGLSFSQVQRKVVLLNMEAYNGDSGGGRFLSAKRILDQTGLAYDTTSFLNIALQYPVILTGSRILDLVFTSQEVIDLENWVNSGGVLISSNVRNTQLFSLFGISASQSDQRYTIQIDTSQSSGIFDQIEDPFEVTISLGDSTGSASYFTRKYSLAGATSLASYEDGACAIAYHSYGSGHTYAFGPDFRDLFIRNQLDLDIEAQRVYSNGFEPSADVIVFLVRNIIRKHITSSVRKHTIPGISVSALMITHDIDSKTGIDSMGYFSTWEKNRGIIAQYNVTTRYVHDTWMTGFYLGSWPYVNQLKTDGHILSSHSVGHFPDFDDETVFPLGSLGNSAGSYQPEYVGGVTTGGTVLGELEVSRDLLSIDHGVPIRTFRPGHLCFHDSLYYGLELTGYEFSSTQSANNILSSFPYYASQFRSFSSEESSLLEIPMTISDVFNSDPINDGNYMQKVGIWTEASRKYHNNNSPVVLLIHPNRLYKLTALERFLDSVPEGMSILPFEAYGEFWRKRDSLKFYSELSNDTLIVRMENDKLSPDQSFIVDMGQTNTVLFYDENNLPLTFLWKDWGNGQRLYHPAGLVAGFEENNTSDTGLDLIYPNPGSGIFTVRLKQGWIPDEVVIMDIKGSLVFQREFHSSERSFGIDIMHLPAGLYFLRINTSIGIISSKLVKVNE